MISDIIFDLGGVLLDLNMQGIGQACQRLGINPELFFTSEDVVEAWNACIGPMPRHRLDMVLELRRRGFHTHLLSNTNDLHWEEIKRRCLSDDGYTCDDLFDHVFVSHEVHLAKPDPEIYRHVVSHIGRPAEQCFFIDDTLINVEAAQHEGLQGAWLDLREKEALTSILNRFLRDS